LSLARANDVKTILQNSLSKAGRNDVKFDGYGENENNAPFDNKNYYIPSNITEIPFINSKKRKY
jgi:hypothetical protein